MEHRLKDLLKEELVILDSGQSLGRADDIVIDAEKHRVGALVVARGAMPETSVVCGVRSVAFTDVIGIKKLEDLHLAFDDAASLALVQRGIRVRGSALLSATGEKLGKISQVLVDESGMVTEYRVRRGFLGFLGKTHRIDPDALRSVGDDAAVLKRGREVDAR